MDGFKHWPNVPVGLNTDCYSSVQSSVVHYGNSEKVVVQCTYTSKQKSNVCEYLLYNIF